MTEDHPLNHDEMLAVLDWYRAAGVDIAVGEVPVDRFAHRIPAHAPPVGAAPVVDGPARVERAQDAPVIGGDPSKARSLAASAQTLEELQAMLGAYDGCGLKLRATQLVFADGNPQADIMLIDEAPGAEEDRQGKPLVGKSGQLLDRMLAAIGLDRSKVYIANTVPWRPPGNRTPTPEEMALCLPFLHRQVELVAPRIVMTLGGPAMQTIFDIRTGIIKMRGKWASLSIGQHQVEAIPTLHPAYLLRNARAKEQAWADMLSLKLKLITLGLAG
ncbi:MAG: uracil-DNA glycosylase [Candidatus Devosia symbiotica]|nr:uracil-DNA glycosylase [Candidatus Devosia symbiotica]